MDTLLVYGANNYALNRFFRKLITLARVTLEEALSVRAALIILALWLGYASPAYPAADWRQDFAILSHALHRSYANVDWIRSEHGTSIDGMIRDAQASLGTAPSRAQVRAALQRLVSRLHDAHAQIIAPEAHLEPVNAQDPACDKVGVDHHALKPGLSDQIPGYKALPDKDHSLPAGMVKVNGVEVGMIRIASFHAADYQGLCALAISEGVVGADAIEHAAEQRLLDDFAARLVELKARGASVLLLDISNNGGGNDWVEPLARMAAGAPLTSARLGFVKDAAWRAEWAAVSQRLKSQGRTALPADRTALLGWAAAAATASQDAGKCAKDKGCISTIGRLGYMTGFVGQAPAERYFGKPWAGDVFLPATYRYRDHLWRGPLVILINGDTWSAAEQLAAEMQDNKAAILMGDRTGGAGCGHMLEDQAIALPYSGMNLSLPDCVRFRGDGSNEVSGVIPDVVLGLRPYDGAKLAAPILKRGLSAAVTLARSH